jgi:hypothetical protein
MSRRAKDVPLDKGHDASMRVRFLFEAFFIF